MDKKKIEFVGRSKQLSKDERKTLADHLTTRALKKEKLSLDKRKTELVDMALEQFLGPYQKQLSELPEDWTYKIEPGKTIIKLDSNQSSYHDIIFAKSSIEMIDLDGKRTIPYLRNENPAHKKTDQFS